MSAATRNHIVVFTEYIYDDEGVVTNQDAMKALHESLQRAFDAGIVEAEEFRVLGVTEGEGLDIPQRQ